MTTKALLLDRDGVINIDHGYVCSVDRFHFVDGIFALVRRAVDLGYRVAVVTNQAGVARGYYSEDDFHALCAWMHDAFAREGAPLSGVFHCPYYRQGTVARYARDSFWRKPNPGMILEAQRRLGLDLGRSLFVGDQPTDMAAARAAGVARRVLLAPPGTPAGDADRVVQRPAEVEAMLG